MINIVISAQYEHQVDPALLEHTVQAALTREQYLSPHSLTVVITDDAQIRQLNRDYLEIDAPTDVLSFPAHYVDPDTDELYLGDILISYPQAASQADSAGQSVENEIQLLAIHGVLHLLGYDHVAADEKQRMWAVQADILKALGISPDKLVE